MQATAGTAGKTVMVCSSCHDDIHKTARAMKSKNAKIRRKTYGPPEYSEKIKILAEYILRGESAYRDQIDNFRHHATAQLTINISPAQLEALHMIKARLGVSSLESVIRGIVERMTGLKSYPKGSPPASDPPSP